MTDDLPNGQVHVYASGNTLFAQRSDRFEDVTYRVADLENPIVLHFINCFESGNEPAGYGAFLSRFGMLTDENEMHIAEVDDQANIFTVGLALSTNTENTADRARDANHFLKRVHLTPGFEFDGPDALGQLVLQPDSLLGFMAMEVALAHEAGAALTSCSHCKKFYLTGPLTGRRSHSRYCSDRCRVAAMRKRNKMEDRAS
ncbi:hypothetical protein [Mesorhizobium sp. M0847]|uniref:hypothetical protein n=1 Tax=unclassified Mesorhizobium TaxID=325217 RepID=UPI003335A2B9